MASVQEEGAGRLSVDAQSDRRVGTERHREHITPEQLRYSLEPGNSLVGSPDAHHIVNEDVSTSSDVDGLRGSRRGKPNNSWTLLDTFDTFDDADKFRKARDFKFSATGQSKSATGVAKVYSCKSHKSCPVRLRIKPQRVVLEGKVCTSFMCQLSGDHILEDEVASSRGIHPAWSEDMDMMFASGAKPLTVLSQLTAKQSRSSIKRPLPTLEQIRNRKANWKKAKVEKQWRNLDHYDELFEWAATKLCNTRDKFEKAGERDLLVLDLFRANDVQNSGEPTFGMVLSCRRLMHNLRVAFDCGDPISVSCDGTYRLHEGGWTLVNFGVMGVIHDSDKREHRQRFFPCFYGFVRSECRPAFEAIFNTAKRTALQFLDFAFYPSTGSLDCSTAISGAYVEAWPDITLITCWPHVFRNCTAKTQLLVDKSYMKNTIIPDLRRMHESGTYQHFAAISKVLLEKWRSDGEKVYADEFEATYLTEPFNTWFVGASKHPGMLAQQQGIESYNKSIKNDMDASKRAKMSYFLENTMPLIINWSCDYRTSAEIRLYAEAPLMHAQLAKARILTGDVTKYHRENTKLRTTFYFNRSSHFTQRATKALATRFDRYQDHSFYRVKVRRKSTFGGLRLAPLITAEVINDFREKYTCECKAFVLSGWVCSHVLAAAAILKELDLTEAQLRTQARRRPGRPRKEAHCLIRDRINATEAENESIDGPDAKLRARFRQHPVDALGLSVQHKFTTVVSERPGETETSIYRGRVLSYQPDTKPPTWTLAFPDDGTEEHVTLSQLIEDLTAGTYGQEADHE